MDALPDDWDSLPLFLSIQAQDFIEETVTHSKPHLMSYS